MVGYIHELPDWPRFHWDHRALVEPLAAVRHRQGRLIGRMESLGFAMRGEALLQTLTEDVLKSSEIEGEQLDRDQVRSSIARRLGMDIGALTPADRDVEGVVEMMLDATQKFADPFTDERLFGWHAALFPTGRSGMRRIIVGAWRDDKSGPMQVVSGAIGHESVHYEAPKAGRVPAEMVAFLDWFNGKAGIDPVLKAGLAHLWFVTIHPFDDGNGRIARAIADMQSRVRKRARSAFTACRRKSGRSGMPITKSRTNAEGRSRYYRVVAWFLACLERAIDGAEDLLVGVLRKARFWDHYRNTALNARSATCSTGCSTDLRANSPLPNRRRSRSFRPTRHYATSRSSSSLASSSGIRVVAAAPATPLRTKRRRDLHSPEQRSPPGRRNGTPVGPFYSINSNTVAHTKPPSDDPNTRCKKPPVATA